MNGFFYAGEDLKTYPFPCLIVSAAIDAQEAGTLFIDRDHVLVTYATQPFVNRAQIQQALDVARAVQGLFWLPAFRQRLVTVGEVRRVYWNQILPKGLTMVPPGKAYGGIVAHFDLIQVPNAQLWS